jgi:polyisoprenoid-binding protein YceI
MKKLFVLTCAMFIATLTLTAQTKYFTKKGKITFSSSAPKGEGVEAVNNRVTSVVEVSTGKIEFMALINAFEFEKAKMQEHFNESYLESKKFPKANFKGTVTNIASVDFKKDGTYNVDIEGDMTIHGVTKKINAKGVFTVKGGRISATADLELPIADYQIKSPKTDQVIKTSVVIATYEPMKTK